MSFAVRRGRVGLAPPPKIKAGLGLVGHVQTRAYQLAFGHVGKLAVIALYYILLETLRGQRVGGVALPDVKWTWDHLLSASPAGGGLVHLMSESAWSPIRHIVRDTYEGLFGILLYKQIGYNIMKDVAKGKPASRLDKFMIRRAPFVPNKHQGHPVTKLQYLCWPAAITVASIPGVALGFGAVDLLHHAAHATWLSPHLSSHPSFAAKFYADDYDAVIVGVLAGLSPLVKMVTNPVLYSNVVYFGQRRAEAGRKCHFWHPPAYRRYVRYLRDHPDALAAAGDEVQAGHRALLVGGWLAIMALAGFGYYVIQYIA